jgi:hypothetical protein
MILTPLLDQTITWRVSTEVSQTTCQRLALIRDMTRFMGVLQWRWPWYCA